MRPNLIRNTRYAIRVSYCVLLILILTGCASAAPTPFIAPFPATDVPGEASASLSFATETPTPEISAPAEPAETASPTEISAPESSPTPELPAPTPSCENNLKWLEDVTVPDGSVFFVAQPIVKQWRVENTGTCDWNDGYRLKLIAGEALGAPTDMPLFPARAGAQVVLQVDFTAPLEAGSYATTWQAYGPDGQPFGDEIYMQVVVQLP